LMAAVGSFTSQVVGRSSWKEGRKHERASEEAESRIA
jgi:hypothetical protein